MKIDECFYLGYIAKAIGTKGELAFKLDVDSPSSYTQMSSIWVQIHAKDDELVPFFPEQAQLINNGNLRIKLEGVNFQEDAKNLVGKSLFLPLTELPELKGNQFYFHEITGFEVEDIRKGKIGVVDKVLEYSTSNLLSIKYEDKEILIPISDDTIVELDRSKKLLKVEATEGLIDLYLEG